ncbi:MAG: hypothetical protein R6W90_09925 [Ignavibacteriaceae bacterium]
MNQILKYILVTVFITGISVSVTNAQMDNLHGSFGELRMGVHAGNQFRVTFYNDGTYGAISPRTPDEIMGEWPINSGHYYLVDGNIFVGSELLDRQGNIFHILSENISSNESNSRGDQDPVTNDWWTFLPLPGFANPASSRIAMAKGSGQWEDSWPSYWPDIRDPQNPYGIYSADGWANSWNGYFGKDQYNADEESYFVADDYNNLEFINRFNPDSTNPERGGLGLRVYVRGFQWAKAAVQDALFCLYDIENIGTFKHDKMIFAYKIGNNMGETSSGDDGSDDNAAFDRAENLAYMSDGDDIGAGGWSPVGFFGGAFLESPGNPYDGIDNDNDGRDGSGAVITEAMFQPRTLGLNDQIVLIDYNTYNRSVTTLAAALQAAGKSTQDTLYITVNARVYRFWNGKVIEEIGDNLFDDNLNGVIDENRGAEDAQGIYQYLYLGYKCVDYFTGAGLDNLLLDERRDDGIDNDGDWDILTDDTGADGLLPGHPNYTAPDAGEGDGVPSPGEPHFDKTDVDETDLLGLTSCNLYEWTSVPQYDDERYWNLMVPGIFAIPVQRQNVELLFGSGYFPSTPGQTERISMGIVLGLTLDALLRTKRNVSLAYNQNYNFSKAPYIPTVKAVAGDNKVTLFWDDYAETSDDPISGKDFEGYNIYRSTDPSFRDMIPITDGYGTVVFRKPIAQFDIDNEYSGFAAVESNQSGIHFYLGDNTGLRHSWVDTTAVNGTKYFYAVTSYDRGDPDRGIDPSECTKYAAVQASGEVELGKNVVIAKPEAPSAGYVDAQLQNSQIISSPANTTTAAVDLEIIDVTEIRDNHTYQITFTDTIYTQFPATRSFTLKDITDGRTLLTDTSLTGEVEGLPIVDGFQISFLNNPDELTIDSVNTGWNNDGVPQWDFRPYRLGSAPVELINANFDIIFSDMGVDTSKEYMRGSVLLPAVPTNFTIINKGTNAKVPFAFRDRVVTSGQPGKFDFTPNSVVSDEVILLADVENQVASWLFKVLPVNEPADSLPLGPGDQLQIKFLRPFLSNDVFEFTTIAPSVDTELAKADMDKIRVVPNPYIVSNSWEPPNQYSNGRGDRELHFTHLPANCTIRIFNVRGQLVKQIDRSSSADDGTEIWNMLSKDNLEISYGIYIYHVEAEGIGEKIGKFVVIK